jgi:hypothetical protein
MEKEIFMLFQIFKNSLTSLFGVLREEIYIAFNIYNGARISTVELAYVFECLFGDLFA